MKRAPSSSSERLTPRQDTSTSTLSADRLFHKRDWQTTEDLRAQKSHTAQGKRSLHSLRMRGHVSTVEITPEIAAKTVAEYLLPMFEKDSRKYSNRTRDAAFGQKLPPLEPVGGTVYGELKLSEQLNVQLAELRAELNVYKQKLHDATQSRESAVSEFVATQRELMKVRTDLQVLSASYKSALLDQQQMELKHALVGSQLDEYKELYLQCETEKKQLSSLLHEERASNDKLRNKATELEHGNSLLKMENDIVGERLKGLYEAIIHISDRKGTEEVLCAEFTLICETCKALTDSMDETMRSVGASLYERDQIRDDYAEMARLRREAKDDRDRIAATAKDQLGLLQAALERARDDLENEKAEAAKLEKQFQDLVDEHEKLRQKMKLNRLKRKQFGEAEEKICKKCQRIFSDAENFNWSCRTHKSEYGDEMWWCCGKTSRDAPGCMVSKHQSKEDEEDETDLKAKEENEKMAIASMLCPSCKEIGHRPTECPKDPNIRSRKDAVEELQRIQVMREKKKQETKETKGLELHQNMMAVFTDRYGDVGFGHGFETSSEGSELSREGGDSMTSEERKRLFFDDVMKMKPSAVAAPQASKIPVAEILTKEMEKETFYRTRTLQSGKSHLEDTQKVKSPANYVIRSPSEFSSGLASDKPFDDGDANRRS